MLRALPAGVGGAGLFALTVPIADRDGCFSQTNQYIRKMGKKDKRVWMEEAKLLLFIDDVIVYVESSKQSTDNLIKAIII